ncbi:MAG: hypothetical protein ABH859_05885 [Pseudomonadota bacterium]
MSLFRLFSTAIIIVTLCGCVSSYNKKAASAHNAYHQGDYQKALELIEKMKPRSRDELLYLLDKGIILHAAEEYQQSNQVLQKAEELSDIFTIKSLSRETSATLWSEEAVEYAGDKHERLMIPVICMLNYIMLDDWDGALVEVRKLQTLAEKIYGDPRDLKNGFSLYLSAIVWETMGKINDAQITYSRINKHNLSVPYYGEDLKKIRAKLNLQTQLPDQKSLAWQVSPNYRQYPGQLIVLTKAGQSPIYVSETVSTGLYTLAMPVAKGFPQNFNSAKVIIDGKEMGQTYPFYNIVQDILLAQQERQKRSLVRKMVKVPVQTGLYVASAELMEEETEKQLAGLGLGLLGLTMSAAEQADERSWRTLPAQFGIGRFYLKPGEHEIEIIPQGLGKPLKQTVNIEPGKPQVILLNVAQASTSYPQPLTTKTENPDLSNLQEETAINSNQGELKLDSALTKIKQGDYHVQDLVLAGINQGGSTTKAAMITVISEMVRGNYQQALPWIEKSDLVYRDYYANVCKYLLRKIVPWPRPNQIKTTDERDLINAFNYFTFGLLDESHERFQAATLNYFNAYRFGLIGKPVSDKLATAYIKSPPEFKQSKQGEDIASQFAEIYVTSH